MKMSQKIINKIWRGMDLLNEALADRIENKKFKKYSPFYKHITAKSFFDNNIQEIDEKYHLQVIARICEAYNKAKTRQSTITDKCYQISPQWQNIINGYYAKLGNAMEAEDIQSLKEIFRNFCRLPVSKGLSLGIEFGQYIMDGIDIRYINDYLRQIHVWLKLISETKNIRDLSFPLVGNPFGMNINGSIIPYCAVRLHYYATRLHFLSRTMPNPVICEIGGGFGGTIFYLLKMNKNIRYFNFDIPEVLALCSYFLMMSFPDLKFQLFGETENNPNVTLMPHFELPNMTKCDISFNSCSLIEMNTDTVKEYLGQIERITKKYFLHHNYIHANNDPHFYHDDNISDKLSCLTNENIGKLSRAYLSSCLFDKEYYECLYEMKLDGS